MAKKDDADRSTDVALDEFCRSLSATDRRVELISAFHGDEARRGNVKDSETNFAFRFQKFANASA